MEKTIKRIKAMIAIKDTIGNIKLFIDALSK